MIKSLLYVLIAIAILVAAIFVHSLLFRFLMLLAMIIVVTIVHYFIFDCITGSKHDQFIEKDKPSGGGEKP